MQKRLYRVITYKRLLEILESLNTNIKIIKIIKVENDGGKDKIPLYHFYIGVIVYKVEIQYFENINEIIQTAFETVDTITNNFLTVRKFDKYD